MTAEEELFSTGKPHGEGTFKPEKTIIYFILALILLAIIIAISW